MSELLRPPLELLRRRVAAAGPRQRAALLRLLEGDPRRGAQLLLAGLRRRIAAERREAARLGRLLREERRLHRAGYRLVAGVDEVGVGPLAGPVVAAAVLLPPGTRIAGVDDSKRLRREQREQLAEQIRERALACGIGRAEPDEVDRLNVYQAALQAMRRAVAELRPAPDHLLVDAREVPEVDCPQLALVGGDRRCHAIACASVLAKVTRDALMCEQALRHPGYGFERHKGYGTRDHLEALRRLGPSPIHRRGWTALAEHQGALSPGYYELQRLLRAASSPEELASVEAGLLAAGLAQGERARLRTQLRRRRQQLAR